MDEPPLVAPNPTGKFTVHVGEAARYLALLDPKAIAFNFSWYQERGTRTPLHPKLSGLEATYRTAPFDDEMAYLLGLLNGHQRAICVCLNRLGAKNGSAARTDDNVENIRAVLGDFDDGLPTKPFPLAPTCLTHTSNDRETGKPRYQAFWRVKGVSLEDFDAIEARLVGDWGADPNSVNRSRVQRLPGFWHSKYGRPHLVRIVEANDATYGRNEIVKAFPPVRNGPHAPADRVGTKSSTSAKAQRLIRKPARVSRDGDKYIGKVDVGALRSALAHLACIRHPRAKDGETYSDNYDTWVRFGLAIKRGLGDEGFELWDEFSRTSSRYPGESETRAKWDRGFDIGARTGDEAITVGSVFHCAKRHGWSFAQYKMRENLARGLSILAAQKELP